MKLKAGRLPVARSVLKFEYSMLLAAWAAVEAYIAHGLCLRAYLPAGR
jgi:hypothetical protein